MTGSAQSILEIPGLGLYISIPFCRSKCTYCNFASGVYPASEHARYVEQLVEDLRGAGAWAWRVGAELPRRVDTVYLGGGTPSLLGPEMLVRVFDSIRAEFELEPDAEITMECAPGQLPDETLGAMVKCGVNRVSLGVQSFVDIEARVSGRLHTRAIVEADLERLRRAGIDNLNIDLIAGLAGQTFASWEESLDALVQSGTPHASVYMLEIDEDSRLGRELLGGGTRYRAGLVPGEDAVARMYERAIEGLAEAGLRQYEISNFSRSGWESRHNLRYWQRRPYLGVGLDASSMLREPGSARVLRATTTEDLKTYLAGREMAEMEWISPERQHEEAWFLGLRLNAGVKVPDLEREFGPEMVAAARETAARLAADGLVEIRKALLHEGAFGRALLPERAFDGDVARLTARGRLLANEVFQEFLAAPVV